MNVTEKILVVDVGLGNIGSICNMIKCVGGDAYSSSSPDDVANAAKIILPGVGSFDAGMKALDDAGLIDPIKFAANNNVNILGICLGMQMLFNSSEEGRLEGLGLIPGDVKKFQPKDNIKVPHMGWNMVKLTNHSSLLDEQDDEMRFYFVHSYYVACKSDSDSVGVTHHGRTFTSAVERNKIMGVQFHPEKSHRFGMALFKRFSGLS